MVLPISQLPAVEPVVCDHGYVYVLPVTGYNFNVVSPDVIINVSVPGVTEEFYMDNEKSKVVIAGPDIGISNINIPLLAGLGFSTNVSGTIENLGTSNEDVTVNFWVNSIIKDSAFIVFLNI